MALLLFGPFTLLFVTRLLLFRDTVRPMLAHPVVDVPRRHPRGLVPIINGLAAVPRRGGRAWRMPCGGWMRCWR